MTYDVWLVRVKTQHYNKCISKVPFSYGIAAGTNSFTLVKS